MVRRLSWADVRDITLAHVLALQKEEAAGERIIVAAGPCVWQEWGESSERNYTQTHFRNTYTSS